MAETIHKEKPLGLPPMQLAENIPSDTRSRNNKRCFIIYEKVITILTLLLVIYVTYNLFTQSNEKTTEIIFVTGIKTPQNTTLNQSNIETTVLKNKTSSIGFRRTKRNIAKPKKKAPFTLKDEYMIKAREAVMNYNVPCSNENKNAICKDLVRKIKSVNDESFEKLQSEFKDNKNQATNKDETQNGILEPKDKEITRIASGEDEEMMSKTIHKPQAHVDAHHHTPSESHHQLTDTCLLAKLLKQHYPHFHVGYDEMQHAPIPSHHQVVAYPYSYAESYPYSRQAMDIPDGRPHPQDIDIFRRFHTTQIPDLENRDFQSFDQTECPTGSVACANSQGCILEKQWCDGVVQCIDASDEVQCNCKSRVDKSRLCDGYFDCPSGEDEMGCFGCAENMFSCEDLDLNSESTCFTKKQRCNSIVDCPNQKDEIECTLLAPSLHEKPIFAISNTEGFIQRNLKGTWYPVCKNPYMWAHDVCRRETGLIIRPPFIHSVNIDPMLRVTYLNTGPGGMLQVSSSCGNSSAVYVVCPDLLCGTRITSTQQYLLEDADVENRLFGRNKRFLRRSPYYPFYYMRRAKRDLQNIPDMEYNDVDILSQTRLKRYYDWRMKRAERVVGGRPSKPASWPWMVALYRNGMFHCGGVVLTQRWIISAAHCVSEFWDHYYEVQVGMLRRFSFSPQEQNHKVTHVIVNQNYDKVDMKNDLSLLRVEPSILFSRWVRPICLPGQETAGDDWLIGPKPGTLCTAVGWGATIEHGPDPDHMREVEVPIWRDCNHREDRAGREICAGLAEGGKDACQGDSGGPLLCRNPINSQQWYIAGIVSHGNGCAKKGEPGVYTRVSLFVTWIRHHTQTKSLPIIQPKQECPGFRCTSGILKCLPKKRVCDKVIDCLGGEDETNCNIMRSTNDDTDSNAEGSIVSSVKELETDLKNTSKSGENNARMRESDVTENLIAFTGKIDDGTTQSSKAEPETEQTTLNTATSTKINVVTDKHSSSSQESSSDETTESSLINSDTIDRNTKLLSNAAEVTVFSHYSTVDKSKSSSEETSSDETTESIPTSTNNDDMSHSSKQHENTRGDLETVSVSQENPTLDSGAFISNKSRSEDNENAFPDLVKDFETSDMSTENIMLTDITSTTITGEQFTSSDSQGDISSEFTMIDTNSVSSENSTETTIDTLREISTEPITTPNVVDTNSSSKMSPDVKTNMTQSQGNMTFGDVKSNSSVKLTDKSESDSTGKPTIEPDNFINETEGISGKELDDDEETIIKRIKDIVKSNLLPAKSKKKFNLPKHFECLRLPQRIPFKHRCDHKADCEDGTDEIGCACVDYIATFDQRFLCDGIVDCADGQDELDCYGCSEEQFLCKTSQMCLPLKHVCDGKSQCPHGEDELDCFALTNGKSITIDFTGRPKVNLEGFLTQKHKKDWNIVCEDNLSQTEQEEAASHICRYLGFSYANKYHVKHINIKDSDVLQLNDEDDDDIFLRKKRNVAYSSRMPIHFTYKVNGDTNKNSKPRHIVINDPDIIKEKCLPNVTRTCMSLYVHCEQTLYTEFNDFDEDIFRESEVNWPWNAKVFVEGNYRCTGILINLSWVLISNGCLWDSYIAEHYMTVVLGTSRVLRSAYGPYEQVYQIDRKIDLHHRKITLLHLKEAAHYSPSVKPMDISSLSLHRGDKIEMCVAVGQDEANNTVSVFLDETDEDCKIFNKCYVRHNMRSICWEGMKSTQPWAGIISCHGEDGWYPAATFMEKKGECGVSERIIGSDIGNIKSELRNYFGKLFSHSAEQLPPSDQRCDGVRCGRGTCISFPQVCDGVKHCEDGIDESETACFNKKDLCNEEPYHGGCECSTGQLKCKNGKCIAKELFMNGINDCGDDSDEPTDTKCSFYLARTMPLRLCDGILHCHDRSDEDPEFCKCFSKRSYKCGGSDHCVAPDMICDGTKDCPYGEDESTCLAIRAPADSAYGTGEVIQRSHGVWHTKCYSSPKHTRSELEAICRELGFISGHARQLNVTEKIFEPRLKVVVEPFHDVQLNNKTIIKLRNTNIPLARSEKDEGADPCFPVLIECV